jgi:hypothetical protein
MTASAAETGKFAVAEAIGNRAKIPENRMAILPIMPRRIVVHRGLDSIRTDRREDAQKQIIPPAIPCSTRSEGRVENTELQV